MRRMRKFVGLLLAMVMVLAMTTTAFATEPQQQTYSITISNSAEGHSYEAYQIFTGKLSEKTVDGKNVKVLADIEWGSSATYTGTSTTAEIAERLDTGYTGEDKLSVEDLLGMIELEDAVANSGSTSDPYVISGLAPGYYLIKDANGSLDGADDAYTEFIVKVVGDAIAEPKSDVPSVQKKVKDINDSEETEMTDWQDSADHDKGDHVPFKLTATLANNVSKYSSYKVVFHDTLSKGLTFDGNTTVEVKFGNDTVTSHFNVSHVVKEDGTTDLTIACEDVKVFGATDSSIITVEYTATLNENAVMGEAGNPNVVYLEYSNNPNWTVSYDNDGNPKNPGNDGVDNDDDGVTDEEDEQPGNKPNDGKDNDGDGEIDEEDEKYEPTGKTPVDKVIVFTYKVVANKFADEIKKGNELAGAGFTLYKYNLITEEWVAIGGEITGTTMTQFVWERVDDGDYKLVETTTPPGYNTIDDIFFTITAEHEEDDDDPALTSLSGDMESGEALIADKTAGSVTANVVNLSGTVLPETGGMGTTLFYLIGAILVIGSAVVMITRKRMSR